MNKKEREKRSKLLLHLWLSFDCILCVLVAFAWACVSAIFYCEPMPLFLWFAGLAIVYYLWAEELTRDENN